MADLTHDEKAMYNVLRFEYKRWGQLNGTPLEDRGISADDYHVATRNMRTEFADACRLIKPSDELVQLILEHPLSPAESTTEEVQLFNAFRKKGRKTVSEAKRKATEIQGTEEKDTQLLTIIKVLARIADEATNIPETEVMTRCFVDELETA